jgi:hypothetical protein
VKFALFLKEAKENTRLPEGFRQRCASLLQRISHEQQSGNSTAAVSATAVKRLNLKVTQVQVQLKRIDSKSLEVLPQLSFSLVNNSNYVLEYVRVFVVFKNNQQQVLYSKQYTLPYPLFAQGQQGDARVIVVVPDRPLPLLRLADGAVTTELCVTLSNDTPISWVPLHKKRDVLFNPSDWLQPSEAGYPWVRPSTGQPSVQQVQTG